MNITIDYSLDDVNFQAEFWVERYIPAVLYGDNAHPAEGGAEIEHLHVFVSDGLSSRGQWFECDPDNFPHVVEYMVEMAEDEFYQKAEGYPEDQHDR